MSSYDAGKTEAVAWIRKTIPTNGTILDVGACDGKWRDLLSEYPNMDAVEIFPPNVEQYQLRDKYRNVFVCDIFGLEYDQYDLIIFGDIIEHMTPEKARAVLDYANPRCRQLLIGVPWEYHQGAIYGNENERHIQDDLTPDLFAERYGDYEVLIAPQANYCYFIKKGAEK